MIEQSGQVVAKEGDFIWVSTLRESACGKCNASSSCGTGIVSKVFNTSRHHSKVVNRLNADVGESVVIGVDERIVLRSALMVYLLPIISLIVFAIIGDSLWPSQLVSALSGLVGLVVGLGIVRWINGRVENDPRYHAVLLRRLSSSIEIQLT